MSIAEIRNAIDSLNPRDKALLTAELVAMNAEPELGQLEKALSRGVDDVDAGRVREVEEVKNMIRGWTSKSRSPIARSAFPAFVPS
ncbi:MAG: hypothetical protein H0X04_03130 [Chthoniobacterales bacterium]|nr:hypothetical protein [Chthoniobacterales bacterium]